MLKSIEQNVIELIEEIEIDIENNSWENAISGYKKLVMRKTGDYRKDSIVKREMFEEHIEGKYNVLFVLDDRNQVVDMWRKELGLTCLQCNYGRNG